MKNYTINEKSFYNNMVWYPLIFLIIFIVLFPYKYVYNFRINQEAFLKLFVIISFFLWILKIINSENILWRKINLNFPFYLFISVMSISTLRSEIKIISIKDFIIFLSYFLIFFIIINNIENKGQFSYFIKISIIASFIVSIYTIIQYYGFDPYLKDLHSLTSTIGQKNWISNYLALIFPIVFSYFLLEKTKKNKIIYYLLLSILYINLMICQSRGIWISIIFTIFIGIYFICRFKFFKIFQKNRKKLILLILTFLIITIIYSTDNPLNKSIITVPERAISTFDEKDPSINTRLLIWKTTFEMIKDAPVLGLGIGTFKMNYLDYQAEFLSENLRYIKYSGNAREAHNEYLQMWAELGVIGLGLFLLIFCFFYQRVFIFFKNNKNIKDKTIILGLVMGITCFLIHCLFTFPFHVPALGATFFILLGLTILYIDKFSLGNTSKKNKIFKKILVKNSNVKIIFTILIFVIMILLIDKLIIKPYIAEIYYFIGMRYNIDKKYDKTLPNFKYAAQLDPYNGRILIALGANYYNLNLQSEAKKILQRAKCYFNDRNIYRNLGLSYMKSGNNEKAEKELNHAIYLDQKYSEAYADLAYLYAKKEDYDKAINEWNKILKIDPNFSEKYNILHYLGLTYQKKEMPDKALEYFLEALKLAPEGSPIIEEIEEEIYDIYKSDFNN